MMLKKDSRFGRQKEEVVVQSPNLTAYSTGIEPAGFQFPTIRTWMGWIGLSAFSEIKSSSKQMVSEDQGGWQLAIAKKGVPSQRQNEKKLPNWKMKGQERKIQTRGRTWKK